MSSLTDMQAGLYWIEGPVEKSKKKLMDMYYGGKKYQLPESQQQRAQAIHYGRKDPGTYRNIGEEHKHRYKRIATLDDQSRARAKERQGKGGKVGGGPPTPVRPAEPGAPGNPKPTRKMKRQKRKSLRARKKKGFGQGAVNPNAQQYSQYHSDLRNRTFRRISDDVWRKNQSRKNWEYVTGKRDSL